MNGLDLIGAAGAAALEERLGDLNGELGVARYMLDQLTADQVTSIVNRLLSNPINASRLKIAVPRSLVAGLGLPEEVLTDERTVHLRHAECDRAALLIVNTEDDQGASLQEVTLIGADQLKGSAAYWVGPASAGLGLPDDQIAVWQAALTALEATNNWPLAQLSAYVALTRQAVAADSRPVLQALGWALPALQLPRDTGYFDAIRAKDYLSLPRWKKLFIKLLSDRRPLMVKHRPNRQVIEASELREQFIGVKDDIKPALHYTVEAFIAAPPGWGAATIALAELEWERDNILMLFSGLKLKKMTLPTETATFFELDAPDRLSDSDKSYLDTLKGRSLKESREEDRDFFEAHRNDLTPNRSLRAKWEKFVYGRPVECTDFLDGLLRSLERLFEQRETASPPIRLEIRSTKRTPRQWLELSELISSEPSSSTVRAEILNKMNSPAIACAVGKTGGRDHDVVCHTWRLAVEPIVRCRLPTRRELNR